jgi:hypothetical protein
MSATSLQCAWGIDSVQRSPKQYECDNSTMCVGYRFGPEKPVCRRRSYEQRCESIKSTTCLRVLLVWSRHTFGPRGRPLKRTNVSAGGGGGWLCKRAVSHRHYSKRDIKETCEGAQSDAQHIARVQHHGGCLCLCGQWVHHLGVCHRAVEVNHREPIAEVRPGLVGVLVQPRCLVWRKQNKLFRPADLRDQVVLPEERSDTRTGRHIDIYDG